MSSIRKLGHGNAARFAGLFLLGSFGAIVLVLSALPSFDARPEYFPASFATLVVERREFATALVWISLAGICAILAGVSLFVALRRAASTSAALALILAAAGAGFLLAAALGAPAVILLHRAAELPRTAWPPLINDVQPWATGAQSALLLFGLGGYAVGLLAAIIAVLYTGVLSRRIVLGVAIAPFALLLLAAILFDGQLPLVWLSVGLPVVFWSVGLGLFLVLTGRVQASD